MANRIDVVTTRYETLRNARQDLERIHQELIDLAFQAERTDATSVPGLDKLQVAVGNASVQVDDYIYRSIGNN